MGEQILSQDEIDALLGAMAKGEVELEPEEAKIEEIDQSKIEAYDLTSKNILLQNQFFALEEVNDKLTKQLQNYFTTLLQQGIETKFVSTEMVSFENFIQGFSNPTCFHIFTMEPLIGSALIAIEPGLVFSLIDCMFGGDGKPLSYERDFTQIEMRLMSKMALGVLDVFESSWEVIYSIKTELKKSESKPEFVHLFNPNDLVMSEIFSINGKRFSGNIMFCMSYLMLEPIKEILSSRFLKEKEIDHNWEKQIKQHIDDTDINVTAELGKTFYTIRDLVNLQVGDLVALPSGPEDQIKINIESVPKFLGYPGVIKGNRAVEITKQIRRNGRIDG